MSDMASELDDETDALTDLLGAPGESPTFSELFAYLRGMNAGLARIIPTDEFDLPIGGIFCFRGAPDDVALLREAAEAVARERGTHIEPGEGDIPWGESLAIVKGASFEFVVTAAEYGEERTCSVVTVGPELTQAVAAAVQVVEDAWEAES